MGEATYYIGRLQCPRCHAVTRMPAEGYGILRLVCQRRVGAGGRKNRDCLTSWVAVRIPPGMLVRQLADVVSPQVADALVAALVRHGPHDSRALYADTPLDFLLPELRSCAYYLQSEPDDPEPFMGWKRAARIIDSLYRESA